METMYGIKGQPHSTADDTLTTLFNGFGNAELPQSLLFTLVQYVAEAYVNRILPLNSNICNCLLVRTKPLWFSW